jgi:Flp pilus assembly protein TadD
MIIAVAAGLSPASRRGAILHELGQTLAAAGRMDEAVTVLRKAVRALDEVGSAERDAARHALTLLERRARRAGDQQPDPAGR